MNTKLLFVATVASLSIFGGTFESIPLTQSTYSDSDPLGVTAIHNVESGVDNLNDRLTNNVVIGQFKGSLAEAGLQAKENAIVLAANKDISDLNVQSNEVVLAGDKIRLLASTSMIWIGNDTLEALLGNAGADPGEINKIETIKVNGVALPITDKTVNITIPSVDGLASTDSVELAESRAKKHADSKVIVPTPVAEYLWIADYADSYTNEAAAYYDQNRGFGGGCSSCVRDGTYMRNYDWYLDYSAEVIVRMAGSEFRHASIGVATLNTNLTDRMMKEGVSQDMLKVLPGMTLDGINDAGVFANINVTTYNPSNDWPTNKSDSATLNGFGVVRHVLDNFTNALQAAQYVQAHIYLPATILKYGYSFHFMIGDGSGKVYIVEPDWDGTSVAVIPVMTNFRVWNTSGVFKTNRNDVASYDPLGSGLTRFQILANGGDISDVWFKNGYAQGFPWPDEFVGVEYNGSTLSLSSTDEVLRAWANDNIDLANRTRDYGRYWQTVHSCKYDITNRTMKVAVQERNVWYNFGLIGSNLGLTEEKVDGMLSNLHFDELQFDNITVTNITVNGKQVMLEGDAIPRAKVLAASSVAIEAVNNADSIAEIKAALTNFFNSVKE